MNYYDYLRQIIGKGLNKFTIEDDPYYYHMDYLHDNKLLLPLYNTLTKNDIVKVIPSDDDGKYIKDINLKDLEVNKTLSKKYNVYYKYTYQAYNRDPESWLNPYSYDFYEFISNGILKVGSHILIILKDKHDKDFEARYIFNYQYPYQPHYPLDIPDEHLKLCTKLIDKLYDI